MAPGVASGVEESVRYLGSDAARRSLAEDVYWPKWDSPWWHMLLLLELGEARRIPEQAARWMLEGLQALKVKTFPFRVEDLPPGGDIFRDTLCHCAVGSVYQVLAACGVDVERELPWFEAWLLRHQMADGGLNCENGAYLVEGECPTSMVATLAPLEAMLLGELSGARASFVDRAGAFLIGRRLTLGSHTQHNAQERERQASWLQLCFPRFYLYDVLRGVRALTRWAELRQASLPLSAIEGALHYLIGAFPDGVVRLGRRSFEGAESRVRTETGECRWVAGSSFALLEAVSRVGEASPPLTQQWSEARQGLIGLLEAQRVTA
jgi:hypothetical protein